MAKAVKMANVGDEVKKNQETQNLRGRMVILNPEESEVAKSLEIKEKGIYGTKFK